MKTKIISLLIAASFILVGCMGSSSGIDTQYMSSGTIIISSQLPEKTIRSASNKKINFDVAAPLLGYIPPSEGFAAAKNEIWLEIERASKSISLFEGTREIAHFFGAGNAFLEPGEYALQNKQKDPQWYASNDYFEKRGLTAPSLDSAERFRRGALRDFALYPTLGFTIHSAPIWTEEVGGLRLAPEQLSHLDAKLPVGARIVIK